MRPLRLPSVPSAIAAAAVALAAAFPALMFIAPNPANAVTALLLVCALLLIGIAPRQRGRDFVRFVRAHWPLCLAFCALPLAVLVHALAAGGPIEVPYTDKRLALFIPMAWLLLQVPTPWLRHVRCGWIAGVAVAAVMIARALAGGTRVAHVGWSNIVPFGDLALLMGVLALVSIGWSRTRSIAALGTVAGALGLWIALASGTRGSWLAVPVFVLLALFLPQHWSRRWRLAVFALAVIAIGAAGIANRGVADRVAAVRIELEQFERGENLDSSIGTRLQLWQASWRIFRAAPLTGVGLQGFKAALREEAAANRITPAAASYDHSHDEALFALASLGATGFAAWLALLAVPAAFFARRLRAAALEVRTSAVMGLSTCAGFAVFGLTEVLSIITLFNAFYTMTLSVLVADILHREQAP